jgi:hypothetical protein
MNDELEQLDDVAEDESLYSLDDEDDDTRDAIRSYIG